MHMTSVQSTNVLRIGWESEHLFVQFHHGTTYRYDGVPFDLYEELVSAPSVGRFLNQEVKTKFPYEVCGDVFEQEES